ncbi:hypothetical protein COB11_05605 [Candidatus Aerophobetes bacterium]|uniref:General glycosylation pathway protein n=1 Tax=Aerophobetes bacterium TaxID=2030807 RepID=A0A2A4YF21_UNCAE|nr:MAG: hypothetical protein COB11_05605 [Candidatus Aerophobetes bacterium]
MDKQIKIVLGFSKAGYIIGCAVLYIISIWIIFYSLYSIGLDISKGDFSVYNLLDEVGLVVFAIAVVDVAKYLTVEEVIKPGHDRPPKEERAVFTKFVMIIATALALEGLVLTIETAKTNLEMMVYPVLLLLMSTIFIVSIGVYQKLNASSER